MLPQEPLLRDEAEVDGGVNLAVLSRHATAMTLLPFGPDGSGPLATDLLAPDGHRTVDVWHARLSGDLVGLTYGLRAEGPSAPSEGHRFDPGRILLDPYAPAIRAGGEDAPDLGVISDHRLDWGDDRRPRHPGWDTILYEAHLRGLTIHPSSRVAHPGTYPGLVEKIPYLGALRVPAVDLLSAQSFMDVERRRGG